MKIFEDYLHIILNHEGGYVNHPNDPGGETKYGICKRAYPNLDIKNLTIDQASEIYHKDYWSPMNLDLIPNNELLKLHLFDMGVNSGIRNAIKLLQAILDTNADGVIGQETVKAIKTYPDKILDDYKIARKNYYDKIIEKNPKLETFRKGWYNRIEGTNF